MLQGCCRVLTSFWCQQCLHQFATCLSPLSWARLPEGQTCRSWSHVFLSLISSFGTWRATRPQVLLWGPYVLVACTTEKWERTEIRGTAATASNSSFWKPFRLPIDGAIDKAIRRGLGDAFLWITRFLSSVQRCLTCGRLRFLARPSEDFRCQLP